VASNFKKSKAGEKGNLGMSFSQADDQIHITSMDKRYLKKQDWVQDKR